VTVLVLDVLLLVGGIGVLYFGAEWLVSAAARLATTLGISPMVVGLTVVSLGTSAPELVVCLLAAMGGNSELAIGNVMGSNLANIGLILGVTALVRPLDVAARVVWREVPLMLVATLALYPLAWDGRLTRGDGVILLLGLVAYLWFVFRSVDDEAPEILDEYEDFMEASSHIRAGLPWRDILQLLAGAGALVVGGWAIVEGAVAVGTDLGVSQVVIGLTVVALGTSLPELATALVAVLRTEADIAVGNIIGSNIFNIFAILGATSFLEPMEIGRYVLVRELPAVLVLSFLVVPFLWTDWQIRRWEGAVLVCSYLSLGFWLL